MKSATPKSETPKSVTSKNTESASAVPAPAVRILKIATCPSLSGKSKLTYHIGCSADENIQFRVFTNTGTGFFSREWVPLSAIEQAFAKVPGEKCITSYLLYSLFQGKSLNTPAFLFAALKNEGLVQSAKDKQRISPATFIAGIKALIDSGADLKVVEKSRPKNDDKGQDRQKSPAIDVIVSSEAANAVPDAAKKKGRPKVTPQTKLDLVQAS